MRLAVVYAQVILAYLKILKMLLSVVPANKIIMESFMKFFYSFINDSIAVFNSFPFISL